MEEKSKSTYKSTYEKKVSNYRETALQYYSSGKSIKQIRQYMNINLRTLYDILFPDLYSHIKEENLPIVDMYLDKGCDIADISFELRISHFHTSNVLYRYLLLRPETAFCNYKRIFELNDEGRTNEEIAEILGNTSGYVDKVLAHKDEIVDTMHCVYRLQDIYGIYSKAKSSKEYAKDMEFFTKKRREEHNEIDSRTFPLFEKGVPVYKAAILLPYDKLTVMRSKNRYNKLNSVQPSKPSTLNDSIEPGAAKEAIKEHFQLPVKLSSQLPEQDDRYFDMYPPEEQEDVCHR